MNPVARRYWFALALVLTIALLAAQTSTQAAGGPAVLVQDFDAAPYRPFSSGTLPADQPIDFERTFFFSQGELWRSDGTEAGTGQIKDIAPGRISSVPEDLTRVGGRLFFVAYDGSRGSELWVSDGTEAGTHIARDINPGAQSSDAYLLTEAGGRLFFMADDGSRGRELWVSDGSEAGTHMVSDLTPGRTGSIVRGVVALHGTVYLLEENSRTLWRSDGTAAGTVAVRSFLPDSFGSVEFGNLIVAGSLLFFHTWEGSWRSDGTAGGTFKISAAINGLITLDNIVVFDVGNQLWRSDGTLAGTTMIKAIPGFSWGYSGPTVVGGQLFFWLTTRSLWKSDGTAAGTLKVSDLPGGAIGERVALGNTLIFIYSMNGGYMLWRSDGTAAGTAPIQGASAAAASWLVFLSQTAGRLLYIACVSEDCTLSKTDGTAAGTSIIKSFVSKAEDKLVDAQPLGSDLFFIPHTDSLPYTTLWRSDGTPAGTETFAYPGSDKQYALEVAAVGNRLYFTSTNSAGFMSLWRSDGGAGAALVTNITARNLTAFNEALIFSAGDNLWRTDGSNAGTVPIAPAPSLQYDFAPAIAGRYLFYGSCARPGPCELRKTDGTATDSATLKVFDYASCVDWGPCSPDSLGDQEGNGAKMYFAARLGGVWGLWKSDGSEAGTVEVKPIHPTDMRAAGGRLFFVADDGAHGEELWVSDGSEAGTRLLKDIWPGVASSAPTNMVAVDGRLFFTAADSAHGEELWVSDGSEAGTRLVRDINPGPAGSTPTSLTALVNGQLFFAASDGVHGEELWVHDSDGTRLAQEIAPGGLSAEPQKLVATSGHLFFSANDGVSGPALWALPLESQPFRRALIAGRSYIQAEDFDRGGEELAYHDAEPLSRRAQYRPGEGVDIETTIGGYQLVYAQPGEWLNYTVDIAATRAYTLSLQVAALGSDGSLHLTLDGADISGPIQVPDTGGWDRWRTVVGPALELPAGRHTLRLVFDRAGPSGYVTNLDWLGLDGATERVYAPLIQR